MMEHAHIPLVPQSFSFSAMDSDEDVPDTRVFVSGLPPNYKSEQLGAHFAGRYQITDAVVIPGRQIGFVGFRNYTLAKNAVKYFDKSYIRMSKISVSIAKPVEMSRDGQGQSAPVSKRSARPSSGSESNSRRSNGPSSENLGASTTPANSFTPYVPLTHSNKRKREEPVQDNQNERSKSKNMVEAGTQSNSLAQPENEKSSKKKKKDKSKDESNEAVQDKYAGVEEIDSKEVKKLRREERKKQKQQALENAADSTTALHEKTDVVDDIKEKVSKKKKWSKVDESVQGSSPSDYVKGAVGSLDDSTPQGEKDDANLTQPNGTRSDLDWLRGKTSRTLDLGDDQTSSNGNKQYLENQRRQEESSLNDELRFDEVKLDRVREDAQIELEIPNGRLFVRNLSYSTTEEELLGVFSKYGKVEEVHVVKDFKTSESKGLAYVQYQEPESARTALRELDGRSFQGRLLHVLPASDKKNKKLDEFELSKLPLKTQKSIKRKAEASKSFNWNSLYMNPDATLASVAADLGIDKAEILDPTSSDAAVKQALVETEVIQKTKDSLHRSGVNIDAFKNRARDDRSVLLKNFPFGTTSEELRELLTPFGSITRLILPSTGTMAVAQFAQGHEAQQALKNLAYRNIRGSVLYLERAPSGLLETSSTAQESGLSNLSADSSDKDLVVTDTNTPSSTLFVRNLNFATTTARLIEIFQPLSGFLSARVKTRTDPKKPGQILSMGFGFVEFRTKAEAHAALNTTHRLTLDNHELQVQMSQKTTDAAEEKRREDMAKKSETAKTKIIIKNLPFEASKKDIRKLFGAYGQLRTVRVPKKIDNTTRGFAFAEFLTAKEAKSAMDSLKNTHLLGRRLVLDFAEVESVDPEEEIRAIGKKMDQQANMVRLNQMTGSARRKFNVDALHVDEMV